MLNLVRGEQLYDNQPLYDRAVSQWQKVVAGGIDLLVTLPLEIASINKHSLGSAVAFRILALAGAGGLWQLQETSQELERTPSLE